MTGLPSARTFEAWPMGSQIPPTVPDFTPLPTPGASPCTSVVCERSTIAFCEVKRTEGV